MNPVTGYLPVWMTSARHAEYVDILSKHYNVEYFNFEELFPLVTIIPPNVYITPKISGSMGHSYTFRSLRIRNRSSSVNQLNRHYTLSLMKLS